MEKTKCDNTKYVKNRFLFLSSFDFYFEETLKG